MEIDNALSRRFPCLYAAHKRFSVKPNFFRCPTGQWTTLKSLKSIVSVQQSCHHDGGGPIANRTKHIASNDNCWGTHTLCSLFSLPVVHAEGPTATDWGTHTLCSLFSLPVVHAEGPTATDKMERNTENPAFHKKLISETEIQEYLEKETGKERLKRMFEKDVTGKRGAELDVVTVVTAQAAGVTFLVMSIFAGHHAKHDFVKKHASTVFKTKFLAFRRMNDEMFLASLKEGGRWALRVAVFSGSFMLVSQTIAVYRNKTSPWEYLAGGMITGALLKANLGIKGVIGGSVFGSLFGFAGGLLLYGAMTLANETQQQRHYWQIQALIEEDREMKGKLYTKTPVEPQPVAQ